MFNIHNKFLKLFFLKMSKELKVDERILRDQIIRKSAVDNMTNVAKQRADLKQGILPIAPVVKSATEIADDRTTQAGEGIQNLIDLGFTGKDAQAIANTLSQEELVAFNRAFPQIKTDFGSRFSVKNTTPAFFIEYLNKYLEALTASSGVPSNLGYLKDNLITNSTDLEKLILTSEFITDMVPNLTALGMRAGSPLETLVNELIAELPNAVELGQIDLLVGGIDKVEGYKIIQIILGILKPLPSKQVLIKIFADGSRSNAQKLKIFLNVLFLTRRAITELHRILKVELVAFFAPPPPPPPVLPPAPPAPVPAPPAPPIPVPAPVLGKPTNFMDNGGTPISTIAELYDILNYVSPPLAVGARATLNVPDKPSPHGMPLIDLEGEHFALVVHEQKGGKNRVFGIVQLPTTTSPLQGEMIKARLNFSKVQEITNMIDGSQRFKDMKASGDITKIGSNEIAKAIMTNGHPIIIRSRSAGAGIKKKLPAKHHTGLRPIKLGKGFQNKDDPYTMYNEELKLTPIRQEDIIKKSPKKQVHTVVEGVEGDEYQKFDDKTNRYIAFGKYAINMRQLKKSVLQIVYKSLAPNPSFPSKKISSELQQYLFELLTNKKSLPALYKHVTEEEKKMFEKLAIFAGVFDKLNLPRINSLEDEKKEMDRFKLLHGEFVAGNDNVAIARELRNLILKFLAENRISKAKAYEYLLELNNA